jgi:uncharacterized membrane protein YhaH (DUF805 family)
MKFTAFRFGGRINRARFWRIKIGMLLVNLFFAIWVAIQFQHIALNPQHEPAHQRWALGAVVLWIALITFWVVLAAGVKRFHDRDKSGWWVLINLIPVAGPVWYLIECGFLPGTAGANKYGPDPLAVT